MKTSEKRSRIMFVGGGSGGHVIPILAILDKMPSLEARVVTDKKYYKETKRLVGQKKAAVRWIWSGKLRRFKGFSLWDYLGHPEILLANFFDFWKILIGLAQSFVMLVIWRPKVVFVKGGYVGVPVGLAAYFLGIPLVLHESDAGGLGLANRILATKAQLIFTGSPVKNYQVGDKIRQKMVWVGVPLADEVTEMRKKLLAGQKIDIPENIQAAWRADGQKPIILAFGGSLGARRINHDIADDAHKLEGRAFVVLVAGTAEYKSVVEEARDTKNLVVLSYTDNLTELIAISQIVVARAGATTLATLELLMKPAILVPHAKLPDGHQSKNAQVLADMGAAICIDDRSDDTKLGLVGQISALLDDPSKQEQMSQQIGKLAKIDAAEIIARQLREMI